VAALYFGAFLAAVALVALMVVLLLLSLLLLFVEPLLMAALQTKRLQPSVATGIVLTLFLLMRRIVYGVLSFLSRSSFTRVCCFGCYCCHYRIIHLSIVVEIINHISHC